MAVGAILVALAWSNGCALTDAGSVTLHDRAIRLRDIVQTACFRGIEPASGDVVVASIPRALPNVHLTRAALANLVRRRIPAIANISNSDPARTITFRVDDTPLPAPSRQSPACFIAAATIEAGEALNRSQLLASACAYGAERAPVAYDRTNGVARARSNISQGDYLGRLSVPARRQPDTGDALVLVATNGATVIERPVIAVQPASHGRAVFVRDSGGRVFSAPLQAFGNPEGAP